MTTLIAFLVAIGLAVIVSGIWVDVAFGNGLVPLVTLASTVRHSASARDFAISAAALIGIVLFTALSGVLRLATFASGTSMIIADQAAARLCQAVVPEVKELPDGS